MSKKLENLKNFNEDEVLNDAKVYVIENLNSSSRGTKILNHSLYVADYSVDIAKHYSKENPITHINKEYDTNIDVFACNIAALFHDIADVNPGNHSVHNILGAKVAKKFLENYDMPKDRIHLIENIILNHRIGQTKSRKTLEEKILPNADAIERIINWESLYEDSLKAYDVKTADKYIVQKLQKSWDKLTLNYPKSLTRETYNSAMKFFESKNNK